MAQSCKRGNKPQHHELQERQQTRHYKKDNKPRHRELQERQQTMLYKKDNKPQYHEVQEPVFIRDNFFNK